MSKFLTILSGYIFVLAAIALRVYSYQSDMKPDEMDVFGVIPFDAMLLSAGILLIFASTKAVSGLLADIVRAWRGLPPSGRGSSHRNGPQA